MWGTAGILNSSDYFAEGNEAGGATKEPYKQVEMRTFRDIAK